MTSLAEALMLALLGLVVGGVASPVGVGGGFIVAPVLLMLYNFTPGGAAGTSLLVVLMNAISATVAYLRQRRVDVKMGLSFSVGTIPGSIAGSLITTVVSSGAFRLYFVLMLILSALYLVFRSRLGATSGGLLKGGGQRLMVDRLGREHVYSFNPHLIIASGGLSGFISGFFGVGGGIVHVPVMIILLGVPAYIATATSQFILVLTASTGIATHAALGHIDIVAGGLIAAGALLGAQIGAKASEKASSRMLELLFAFFLIAIAVNMLLQSIAR
ncbi:MAG: sulfite exporter TauE/SafE family protein [Nitrososphaerota archaeon]